MTSGKLAHQKSSAILLEDCYPSESQEPVLSLSIPIKQQCEGKIRLDHSEHEKIYSSVSLPTMLNEGVTTWVY